MGNVMTMFKDRWTVDNPDPHAFSPRLSYGADANNYKTSTWWQRDSGYLRLKNVEIGYTLPKRWTSKICIESLRVFFAADNLYFTSAHTGFDPRTAYTGQNAFGFPQAKTFTFGITMNL